MSFDRWYAVYVVCAQRARTRSFQMLILSHKIRKLNTSCVLRLRRQRRRLWFQPVSHIFFSSSFIRLFVVYLSESVVFHVPPSVTWTALVIYVPKSERPQMPTVQKGVWRKFIGVLFVAHSTFVSYCQAQSNEWSFPLNLWRGRGTRMQFMCRGCGVCGGDGWRWQLHANLIVNNRALAINFPYTNRHVLWSLLYIVAARVATICFLYLSLFAIARSFVAHKIIIFIFAHPTSFSRSPFA